MIKVSSWPDTNTMTTVAEQHNDYLDQWAIISQLVAKTKSENRQQKKKKNSKLHFVLESIKGKCFYFVGRAGLTVVKKRGWRRTFWGWEQTSVSQCFQLLSLLWRGGHTEGPAELMWTGRHANQRGTGALRGSGKWERWSEKTRNQKKKRPKSGLSGWKTPK